MTVRNLVLLLTCSALWGCVASVHPLYTEKDVVFDPDLCGTWFDLDSGEQIPTGAFAQDPDNPKAYRLTDTKGDDKDPEVMTVHLVKVEGKLFFDAAWGGGSQDIIAEGQDAFHWTIPVHYFGRIRKNGPDLEWSMLDYDWLEAYLRKHRWAVRHETFEDAILLTAKPKALQRFLVRHWDTKDAWSDWEALMTKRPPAVAKGLPQNNFYNTFFSSRGVIV